MENPTGLQTVVNWLLGVFMALLSAILAVYRKKIDDLEHAHTTLLSSYVTRAELQKQLDDIASARVQMHIENTRKLERIDDGLTRIHNRIDQVVTRPPNTRTRSSDP